MKDTKVKAKESKKSIQLAAKNDKAKKRLSRKEQKAKKDPNKPKRPPTAFFLYLEEFRKVYKEKHPNSKGVSEVAKACGEKWRYMSVQEKAPYETRAVQKKADYDSALSAYNKNLAGPGSGHNKVEKSISEGDEEEEVDADDDEEED